MIGGFPQPDGAFWYYREPEGMILVQNGKLRVTAAPLTRSHDSIQFLDNAKHMYFSRETFACPDEGEISFKLSVACTGIGTSPGDLYDGFVSVNLLDFSTGWALDFFTSNDKVATVFGRLPFPGVTVPDTGPAHYFCLFKELDIPAVPGQVHEYEIVYSNGRDEVIFYADGEEVNRERNVPDKLGPLTIALGIMTEKDIAAGKSTSLHGQGVRAEWSPVTITTRPAPG
jgi:hypothetical protein